MSEEQPNGNEAPKSPHVPDANVQIGHRLLPPQVAERIRGAIRQFAQSETPAPPVDAPAKEELPPVEPAPAPAKVEDKPAPDLPPHVLDAAVRVQKAQEAIDKQKTELKSEIESLQKFRGAKSKYKSDRIGALKEALAYLTDHPADDELYEIVGDYTRQVLQIEPTSDQRALSETAKLRADVQALRQEQAETERKTREEAERKQRDADEREAVQTVSQILSDAKAKFPFLTALGAAAKPGETSSADAVWQEIRSEHERSGQTITVDEAAARVEKALVERLAPFAPLFSQSTEGNKTTEQRPKSERPRTVSSSLSSAAAPVLSEPTNGRPLTEAERRQRTLAKIRQALQNPG